MSAHKAIAELYKHAVAEGALTGDPTLDAATIAASMPTRTRAQRIRSYMQDSGMSRCEAAALVDFEGDE